MMLADIHGHVQRTWKASHVHDLAVSTDGQLLFCVTSEHKVRLNNLQLQAWLSQYNLVHTLVSVAILVTNIWVAC